MSATELEIPRLLPGVKHLSVSSLRLAIQCPEKWRRRYLESEYEPSNGNMLLGSSVGAAETASYQDKITSGVDYPLEQVLDTYSDEWDLRSEREEIVWGDDDPGTVKDHGVKVISRYHQTVAPTITPEAVERKVSIRLDGADWDFIGYLDLETTDGKVADLKVKAKAMSALDAATDLQPAAYLAARRAEGNTASGFDYHVLRRPSARLQASSEVVETQRSDAQLDGFLVRVARVAAELAWRAEHDVWGGAVPGAWYCSERYCGFWDTCIFGSGT